MARESLTTDEYNALLGKRKGFEPLSKPGRLTTITITIPLPPRQTHPNARSHWAAKADAKKRQRSDAALAALAALGGKASPVWGKATVHATFYRPGPRDRISDPDNLTAWLKASLDGLQDAGVICNDRGLQCLAPAEVVGKAANGMRGVILVVTKAS